MENITKETVQEVISKLNKSPRYTDVVISLNSEDVDGLGTQEITAKQFVLAVGPHVQDLTPGMEVEIEVEKLFKQVANSRDAEQAQWVPNVQEVSFAGGLYAGALVSDRIIKLVIN